MEENEMVHVGQALFKLAVEGGRLQKQIIHDFQFLLCLVGGETEEEVKLSGWLKAQVEQKLSEEEEKIAKELEEKNFFPEK